jgi:hypothetical protein
LKKRLQVEMRPPVERGIVFGVDAPIGEVVLADQPAARHVLHAVEEVVPLVREIERAVVPPSRKLQPADLPVTGDRVVLVGDRVLKLRERVGDRRDAEVREGGVQPDDLVVLEADVAR